MRRSEHTFTRPSAQRGFTLVELLVSLLAGLFVASSAFLLARNATRFFQHEARISAAQFGAVMGLGRLQADLQRAAFLSSPNIQRDPLRCGDVTGYPDGLALLAGVTIEEGGSVVDHAADHVLSVDSANDLNPDALIIGGAYSTTEQFAARGVFASAGGGVTVYLQTDDGPMVRTTVAASSGAASLAQIFAPGKFLRIVDSEGRQSYGLITAFTNPGGTSPQISLAASPAVPSKATYGVCGYGGMSVGALVSPVTRVRWDLRSVSPVTYPQYAGLFVKGQTSGGGVQAAVTEAARTELVRVELDADDVEIASTLEVVAEYAVDLKFGITRAVPATSPLQLVRYAIGAAEVYTTAAPLDAAGTPEQIRAVQVRLTTRGSERDRDVPIAAPTAGGLYRFSLGANLGYVRVRSLVADVALPNQAGVMW